MTWYQTWNIKVWSDLNMTSRYHDIRWHHHDIINIVISWYRDIVKSWNIMISWHHEHRDLDEITISWHHDIDEIMEYHDFMTPGDVISPTMTSKIHTIPSISQYLKIRYFMYSKRTQNKALIRPHYPLTRYALICAQIRT